MAAGAVLVVMVAFVICEVVLRGLLGHSLGFAEEVAGYCVVMLKLFGAALARRDETLFRVHFLFDALPVGTRVWLVRLFAIAALAICAVLARRTVGLVLSSHARALLGAGATHAPVGAAGRHADRLRGDRRLVLEKLLFTGRGMDEDR